MAKKRASRKPSTGSQPPKPPKDTSVGKQPRGLSSSADIARAEAIRQNDLRIRTAQMNLDRNEMQNARNMARGGKSQFSLRAATQAQQNISAMERQSPQGSRYSPKTRVPSNISVPRLPANPIAGRTVEYGTRSLLQGLRNWIAGGGGSRLTGR